MEFNHKIKKTEEIDFKEEYHPITNQWFYSNLFHYTPCFSNITSTPYFLQNRQSISTTLIILIINILAILQTISLYSISRDSKINHFIFVLIIFNLIPLFIMDICYLLTIKLNPGIRNLSKITHDQYEELGKQYCIYCENYKTYKMTHCSECKICIQNFDHHCSLLNRCIGGSQRYAFFGLILTLGITLCSLLMCGLISLILS